MLPPRLSQLGSFTALALTPFFVCLSGLCCAAIRLVVRATIGLAGLVAWLSSGPLFLSLSICDTRIFYRIINIYISYVLEGKKGGKRISCTQGSVQMLHPQTGTFDGFRWRRCHLHCTLATWLVGLVVASWTPCPTKSDTHPRKYGIFPAR